MTDKCAECSHYGDNHNSDDTCNGCTTCYGLRCDDTTHDGCKCGGFVMDESDG